MAQVVLDVKTEYAESLSGSGDLFKRALRVFPGGVTHDLRSYEPFPIYATHASAGRKWDVDGREYVDLWVGHGALLLGHCHPAVVKAVSEQVALGTHFGASHELEVEWGEWVQRLIPTAERVRFTSSGTEATLMALRLARTFTGRSKVLKFYGHFHGWHDNLMIGVNPPFETPVPPGVLEGVADSVVLCPPNDIRCLEEGLEANPDIACVILEPTGGSFGVVPLRDGFLQEVRELTTARDVLLIFDEVITGFRCSPAGAQGHFDVKPDLTSLAKILAGGLPGGCLTGREDILELLSFKDQDDWNSQRKMPHQGTFNGNPISAAAGIATLCLIESGEENRRADESARILRDQLNDVAELRGVNWVIYGEFSGVKFLPNPRGDRHEALEDIRNGEYDYRALKSPDPRVRDAFRAAMQLEGVDLNGLTAMTSSAHTTEDLDHVVNAFESVLYRLEADGIVP